MGKLRRLTTAAICLLPISRVKPPLLRLIGHRVSNGARIAPSLVLAERLFIARGARIGPLNFIRGRRISMRKGAYLGYGNYIKGYFSLQLGERSGIGNRNVIAMGNHPQYHCPVSLTIDYMSNITSSHYINLEESISIGSQTVIAGAGSQLWTHGFVHLEDTTRAEIRGRIKIGDNVYIGSHSCIGPGLQIGDSISVGAHSSIATSLTKPGVYVSQPLRFVDISASARIAKLERVDANAGNPIYWKNGGGDRSKAFMLRR